MDNKKTNSYYLEKIVKDLRYILKHTHGVSRKDLELEENELLVDAIMFRLVQVAENADKLTPEFREKYNHVPWRAMKGMRNRIVHEYGNVDLSVVYETVTNDIPPLVEDLEDLLG